MGDTREAVDNQKNAFALATEMFGDRGGARGGAQAQDGRIIGGNGDGDGAPAHRAVELGFDEIADLASALADQTDDGDIGSIEFKDLSPAPGLELLASWGHYHNDPPDLDSDDQPMVDTSTYGEVFCAGPVPRCTRWQTQRKNF